MHGFFPTESRCQADRAAESLRRRSEPRSGFVAVTVMLSLFFGPLAVGVGAPFAIAVVRQQPVGTWGTLLGLLLVVGLYLVIFGAMGGGLSKGPPPLPIERVPGGPIGSRRDGEVVMVSGRVEVGPAGTLPGEVTGKPRVWSKVSPIVVRRGERGVPGDRGGRAVPFRLAVGEEHVDVDPAGGILRRAPHHARGLLPLPIGSNPGHIAATEDAVGAGDTVVVLGVVRTGDAYRSGVSLGSGPDDRVVVTSETREELIASYRQSFERRGARSAIALGLVFLCGAIMAASQALMH